MGELIHIRIEKKVRDEIQKIIKDNMFSSESEFIRDALRNNIEVYRKIEILKSMQGKIKPSKNPTKIKRSEVFRTFGLEN